MTGLVRKAALLGVFGLLAASSALAFVPDPSTSTTPTWCFVVGFVGNPSTAPDEDGANGGAPIHALVVGNPFTDGFSNRIVIKDFAGNPISNVGVHIKFPCDIRLCTTGSLANGVAATVNGPTNTLNGTTDASGTLRFVAVGASDNGGTVVPCGPPGCVWRGGGLNSTVITVDGYTGPFKTLTAVAPDLNGNAPVGPSPGVSSSDVFADIVDTGAYALVSSTYKGRSDANCTGDLSAGDWSALFIEWVGPLALRSGFGCTSYLAKVNNCP